MEFIFLYFNKKMKIWFNLLNAETTVVYLFYNSEFYANWFKSNTSQDFIDISYFKRFELPSFFHIEKLQPNLKKYFFQIN